jgi:hypothetical protein
MIAVMTFAVEAGGNLLSAFFSNSISPFATSTIAAAPALITIGGGGVGITQPLEKQTQITSAARAALRDALLLTSIKILTYSRSDGHDEYGALTD